MRNAVITLIILLFTVIIYPLTNEKGLYLPLVYFMYSSPLLMLIFTFTKVQKKEISLVLLIPLLFMSGVIHPSSFRFSTVLYSCLFILVFILYHRLLLKGSLTIQQYLNLLSRIIYAFFIVLVIQQIQFVIGMPIININWLGSSFKLNSLSYEASYVATLPVLLMISYLRIKALLLNKELTIIESIKDTPTLWLSFIYTIFTCGASTVFFTFPMFMLYFYRKKISIRTILPLFFTGLLGLYLIISFNPKLVERQVNLIPALLSLDITTIVTTDVSASTRIIPFLVLFNRLVSFDINILFGYGIDYGQALLGEIIVGDSSRIVASNGTVNFILDYGLIAGIIFIANVIKFSSNKIFSYETLFFFSCFFIFGFNHYLTWAFLIFMSTNRYFERTEDASTQTNNK